MGTWPTISVIIPTYNCRPLLVATLASLKKQDYPVGQLELIAVDGGSTDGTRSCLADYGWRIIDNPQRSNLYGLPLGFAAARGELVLHLDDDNVLDRPDWLKRMVEPFQDPAIVAAEPLFYTATADSPPLTRYISLLGADDPLIVYLGFHDRFSYLTNTWTGVPHQDTDMGGYLAVRFPDHNDVPTLGCNAFLVRTAILQAATKTPWLHIDGARRMLQNKDYVWAKVKVGIINNHASSIVGFFIKKMRRLQTRSREAKHFEYFYPITIAQLVWLALKCILVVPLLFDTAKAWWRKPDPVWLLHPLLTLGTAAAYAHKTALLYLGSRAARPKPIRVVN